jgi:hypothetical protein
MKKRREKWVVVRDTTGGENRKNVVFWDVTPCGFCKN